MKSFERWITIVFAFIYVAALLAYAWHGLPDTNPQFDNQVVWYARDMRALLFGEHGVDFLLAARKYPLLYVAPFAVVQSIAGLVLEPTSNSFGFITGRITTLLYAAGLFWVTFRLSKKLTGSASAVQLLCFSVLTFMFASAIRPHLPVAFWTVATAYASILLREAPTAKRSVAAWGCAFFAFATLQSGALAFLFPLWATIRMPREWTSWIQPLATCACVGLMSLVIGYPFILSRLFGFEQANEIGIAHDAELTFGIGNAWRVIMQLLGSELPLLAFGVAGAWILAKEKNRNAFWSIAMIYCVLFFATFAFHSYGMSRFFLSVLPFVALAGAKAFDATPRWGRIAVTVCVAIVFAKMGWLALQPDSYAEASRFVETRAGSVALSEDVPQHFMTIPESRFPASSDSTDFRTIVTPDYGFAPPAPWERCASFTASPTTNEIILLWNDTPLALYRVLEARMLGPNISVYCLE